MNKQELGRFGEEQAARYLSRLGFMILAINYRTKVGEIDIVAKKNHVLHFVEVKTRSSLTCGRPLEAVTLRKQVHIKRAAQVFLEDLGQQIFRDYDLSFDVIEIYKHAGPSYSVHHLVQCF